MMNRHGLIAGRDRHGQDEDAAAHRRAALGAGRAGLRRRREGRRLRARRPRRPGRPGAKRDAELGIPYAPTGFPIEFLSIGGHRPRRADPGHGLGLRARSSWPRCSSANETQESSLNLVFHYADQKAAAAARPRRPARAADVPDSDEGKDELEGIGGAVEGDRRRAPARPRAARDRRRHGVLRRADVRHRRPHAHRAGRQRRHLLHGAPRGAGQAGALLDRPDVARRRAVRDAARGRRRRQAQARLLLRRGASAVHRRVRRRSSSPSSRPCA